MVMIDSRGAGFDEALALTDKTAEQMNLSRREAFHLRLLAEETLGMLRAITGDYTAEFRVETEGRTCRIYLSAKSDLDYAKRKELLNVSTTGKNAARVGIMEKIRGIFEAGLFSLEEGYNLQSQYGASMFTYGTMGMLEPGISDAVYAWSMQKYKAGVQAENDPDAWDELEKSIIANIADDVTVGVRRGSVELVITKIYR